MAKIINTCYTKDDQIGIDTQVVRYIQNTDTWDMNIDGNQYLTLKTVCGGDFSEKDNTDSFIRMEIGDEHSEQCISPFWSIAGPEDLVEVFNDFARRTGMSCRWEIKKYHVKTTEERIEE